MLVRAERKTARRNVKKQLRNDRLQEGSIMVNSIVIDDAKTVVRELRNRGMTPHDIASEVHCRNKWGKYLNRDLHWYSTLQLVHALESWFRYIDVE